MSATDDLNKAVADVAQSIKDAIVVIKTPGVSATDAENAVTALETAAATLEAAVAPPAPTPAPAPATGNPAA